MKNKIYYALTIILFILLLPLFLGNSSYKRPNTYYQVYLEGNYIGTILSETELKQYINSQTDTIRENIRVYNLKIDAIDTFNSLSKYSKETNNLKIVEDLLNRKNELDLSTIQIENLEYYKNEKVYELDDRDVVDMHNYVDNNDIYLHADKVYIPNGVDIKKVYTYDDEILSVKDVYKKIVSERSCTIAGYRFTIKSTSESVEDITIYTLDREIFNDAIEKLITIFLPEEEYETYKKNLQEKITTTGSIIKNVYIEQEISYKAENISVEEKIYTNSSDLTDLLLYGSDYKERYVTVKIGDTIESISEDNNISVQEFLISNPQYTSKNNLIAQGAEIKIASISPRIEVVVEKYEVFDQDVGFSTTEKYDPSMNQGNITVVQDGETGIERITQDTKIVNGAIAYVDPVDKKVIKASVPKIVKIGTKYVPHIGSTTSWGWPTTSYVITSYYGLRPGIYGLYDSTNWHSGIDIGSGWGAPIYAANNGVIIYKGWSNSYGYYIQIDHNNGFYTLYAHMSSFANVSVGQVVSRGDTIGYVGATGVASGPHLHYEIRICQYYNSSCIKNPLDYY